MYGKLFDQMYKGTLADDWQALVTFQQMIIMSDPDGVIDVTPGHISRHTGIPVEVISAGVAALERPDPHSRTPDMEGKRIVRLEEHRDWGWYIVNHEKYKNMKDMDEVRAANRERKRQQRERAKSHTESQGVTEGHAESQHTDTDTDNKTLVRSEKQKRTVPADFKMVLQEYAEALPTHQQPVLSRWRGSDREKNLNTRWKEDERHQTREFWSWFFGVVKTNPHWMGDNDRGWKPDIGWLLKRSNFDKVLQRGANDAG